MTQTFSANAQNDIYIGGDNKLAIATGIEAVLFGCASAAKAQLAEMIYAYDKGVANFETVWRNSANVAQFEASVRTAIQSVQGVTGIQTFTVQVIDKTINYQAVIQTIYGQGGLNG